VLRKLNDQERREQTSKRATRKLAEAHDPERTQAS
jgi:hypothetical protein